MPDFKLVEVTGVMNLKMLLNLIIGEVSLANGAISVDLAIIGRDKIHQATAWGKDRIREIVRVVMGGSGDGRWFRVTSAVNCVVGPCKFSAVHKE